MDKNVFYFPIWGSPYIKLFANFALKCLYRNLLNIKQDRLKESKIEIWTFKKDIPKIKALNHIKLLKKKIKVNIESIDLIYDSLKKNNLNKYQTLSIFQKIFINSHSYKFKYFWFIYPDFIFSDNMIKNFLNLKKTYDGYFIPVPQLIEENVVDVFKNENFQTSTLNITQLLFKYLHPIVKICDVKKSKTNTPSMFLTSNKTSYALKYFHMHPIVIKSDIVNYEMNNKFYSSLDEGLVEALNEKNIFITKDNFFGICASLLKEKEYHLPNEKFSLKKSFKWCKNHVNKTHIEISKHTYFIKKNKNITVNQTLEKIINNRLLPIINKLKKYNEKKIKYPDPYIHLAHLNDTIYSIISNNHFKKYFKVNSVKLKKKIKNQIKSNNPIFIWLNKIYLKNL